MVNKKNVTKASLNVNNVYAVNYLTSINVQ